MANNIEVQKLKKECPDFFERYPSEFLKFILSENTSSRIAEICLKNKVEDEEKIEKIAYRVVLALLGRVPMKNLPLILEKGVGLNSEMAKEIYAEVNQFIFFQIKKAQPEKTQITQPTKTSPLAEKKPEKPLKKDVYRETTE